MSGPQDLVQEVTKAEPLGNGDPNIIKCSILIGPIIPKKPTAVTLNYKNGNYAKLSVLVRWKLKGVAQTVNCITSKLLENTIIEAQTKLIPPNHQRQ